MHAHKTLGQAVLVASSLSTRTSLLPASGLAHHRSQRTQRTFATISATVLPMERANTIGFIGLGAMGNHMVESLTVPRQ